MQQVSADPRTIGYVLVALRECVASKAVGRSETLARFVALNASERVAKTLLKLHEMGAGVLTDQNIVTICWILSALATRGMHAFQVLRHTRSFSGYFEAKEVFFLEDPAIFLMQIDRFLTS